MIYELGDHLENAKLTVPVGSQDHIQGPEDAPLTLVEYGDYQCPYCGEAHEVVKAIQSELGDQLRFVFRHFPLTDKHPNAEHAAEAAEAAGAQGRFWEMHDVLYESQEALEDEDLAQYAMEAGLDARAVIEAVQKGRFSRRIHEDFRSGVESGVNGTPTFYINDWRYDGNDDVPPLLAALEEANEAQPEARPRRRKRRSAAR